MTKYKGIYYNAGDEVAEVPKVQEGKPEQASAEGEPEQAQSKRGGKK